MTRNSVMCAVDVNDYDQQIVDWAAMFAESFDTELSIVYVTLLPEYERGSGYHGSIRPLGRIYADSETLQRVHPNNESVHVSHWHMLGMPKERLMDAINDHEPQLVVVGTHGRTGLKRLLLGSVAEHLLRHAECPVLIYRSPTVTEVSVTGASSPSHVDPHRNTNLIQQGES